MTHAHSVGSRAEAGWGWRAQLQDDSGGVHALDVARGVAAGLLEQGGKGGGREQVAVGGLALLVGAEGDAAAAAAVDEDLASLRGGGGVSRARGRGRGAGGGDVRV